MHAVLHLPLQHVVHYLFVSKEAFAKEMAEGKLLECVVLWERGKHMGCETQPHALQCAP